MNVSLNFKIELVPTPEGKWQWQVLKATDLGHYVKQASGVAKNPVEAVSEANWMALELSAADKGSKRLTQLIRETRERAELFAEV